MNVTIKENNGNDAVCKTINYSKTFNLQFQNEYEDFPFFINIYQRGKVKFDKFSKFHCTLAA